MTKIQKPILICDVDEVVMPLVSPLTHILKKQGYVIRAESYSLNDNVRHRNNNQIPDREIIKDALTHIYKNQTKLQPITKVTTNAINNIAKEMDVVFLTNMPDKYKTIRSEHLKNNGLGFELITNQGSKVEAVREITKNRKSKIGFIDDSPINLRQIKKELSHVELFHFMKSNVFRKFTPDVHTHCSTGSWTVAKKIIKQILLG